MIYFIWAVLKWTVASEFMLEFMWVKWINDHKMNQMNLKSQPLPGSFSLEKIFQGLMIISVVYIQTFSRHQP